MTPVNRRFDVVVVGGGIAGISAAFELVGRGHQVAVVERESTLTAHSTGRSAAQFLASYGEDTNRLLSAASRFFLDSNADGFADSDVLLPRNVLWVAPIGHEKQLAERLEANSTTSTACEALDIQQATEICGALDPSWLAGAVLEYGGFDIDVAGFFWCAGQGGTGIQTAPAIARLTADLIGDETPDDALAELSPRLSPERFAATG